VFRDVRALQVCRKSVACSCGNGLPSMKHCLAIFTLLLACVLRASEPSTNLLSIWLVDAKLSHPWPTNLTSKPDDLKLISPPVLADHDFVSFDVTNYSFVVTAGAAKRLVRSIWDLERSSPTILVGGAYELIPWPAPFVIKASGEPVYGGAFYTDIASLGFDGPVILADSMFISNSLTANVTFHIALGYPGTFPGTPDPRLDRRIVSAAQKLFAGEKK